MITAVAEAAKHVSLWTDYVHTQFDPAHLLSELGFTLFFDGIVAALLWPLVKRAVRLHDRKEHANIRLLPDEYPERRPELFGPYKEKQHG